MESRRQLQVGKLIQQTLSDVFRKEGFALWGRAMVTVSKVKLTPDLGQARVYLSIFNAKDKDNEVVLAGIRNNTFSFRKYMAAQIRNKVRKIPELEFHIDDTMDEVFKMDELFKKLGDERKNDPPKIDEDEAL